jgi:hypothetical protein
MVEGKEVEHHTSGIMHEMQPIALEIGSDGNTWLRKKQFHLFS